MEGNCTVRIETSGAVTQHVQLHHVLPAGIHGPVDARARRNQHSLLEGAVAAGLARRPGLMRFVQAKPQDQRPRLGRHLPLLLLKV